MFKNQLSAVDGNELAAQIRGNIAFEQMVVSVLVGAFSGGAMTFGLKIIRVVLQDFSLAGLLPAALEAVFVTMLIFLVGFFTSIVIGAPLFSMLEKRKHRNAWPYLAAALTTAIVAFFVTAGGFPTVADLRLETALSIFAPAIIIALTFAKLMSPHWRAAKKAEEAEASAPVYFRLN